MAPLAVGSVVVVDFPYSDYINYKQRPALVIGLADFGDYILCQITSRHFPSRSAVDLKDRDFVSGGLKRPSFIRPDKIYTVDKLVIDRPIGKINDRKLSQVKQKLAQLFALPHQRS